MSRARGVAVEDGTGLNGWDKRFFVLEGSDQVRSAVLRYWDQDPAVPATSKESVKKAIVLWDANVLKAKAGTRYKFKDGEECFKVYHFYRDYRFCVVADSGVDTTQERDEWMSLISDEMRFAGVIE